VISNGASAASLTKAGAGTLTLSGTNTYTGATTVSAGTLKVTADDALGTTAAGTTVASGATLDFANVTYSTTEAVTVNGGTISTSTGTSSFAGAITLGAHSTFDVDGTQLTVSGNVTDGAGTYNITKTGNGILVLSNTTNSYDGTTTISAGTLTVTGRLDSGTYSANIINNSALIYNSTSAQEFSGVVSGNGTLEKDNANSTLTRYQVPTPIQEQRQYQQVSLPSLMQLVLEQPMVQQQLIVELLFIYQVE
jgi:autotransporter-associated beta strand protein